MYIKRLTNRVGEELNSPISGCANSYFHVDLYGTTNPNSDYSQYCASPRYFHTFEYVESGMGHIEYDGKKITVAEGDFYYLRRGFVGQYYADKNDPYKKIWANIVSTMLDKASEMFGLTDSVTVCRDNRLCELLRELHAELDSCENKSTEEVLSTCSEIAFKMMSAMFAKNAIKASSYKMCFSDSVKRYIDTHVTVSPTIEELAARFHMSEGYLIRRFKAETGMTPMRYYNDSRINSAKKLLSDGHTAKSTAAMLNYSDAAYFTRCFKDKFGMLPSEFVGDKKNSRHR